MDLVGRLKEFLSVKSIPVTQFADACNIPRPTVSQIINGRNKKISDEIISKIHNAFPDLSVYWLMFGEGNMLAYGEDGQNSDTQSNNSSYLTPSDLNIFGQSAEGKEIMQSTLPLMPTPSVNKKAVSSDAQHASSSKASETQKKEGKAGQWVNTTQISFTADSKRTISKIVVFYNDNSFESFGPSGSL